MPFQMHRLFITILIIQKRRCGDSDLTPGLTGSSVGSLATRESAPQPPPPSSILLLNPLPLFLLLLLPSHPALLSKLVAHSQQKARLLSVAIFCQVPFPHLQSTMLHSSLLSCQIAQHHVLQGRCSYCGGNRDLIAK